MKNQETIDISEMIADKETRSKLLDAMMADTRQMPVGQACFTVALVLSKMEGMSLFEPLKNKLTYDEYRRFTNELSMSILASVYASSFDNADEAKKALYRIFEAEEAQA